MARSGRGSAAVASRVRVDRGRLAAFRARFDGEIVEPGDRDYERRRLVWNAMIDRRPALIVRPLGSTDVAAAVAFAREAGLEVAVKGGGHGASGPATVDDGLMIDLGAMRSVRVDPVSRRALAGGGARLVDVDRETSTHGLAVPAGVNWDTGLAGLALGGGYGWLARLHGLTCDNLLSAEVVTADARIVRASPGEEPELFWGLRGGGGNFGIVTWFELRAHPVPATVRALDLAFDPDAAFDLAMAFREVAAAAPREVTSWFAIEATHQAPGLPTRAEGGPGVKLGFVVIDEHADLAALAAPLRRITRPWTEEPWSGSFRALQHGSTESPGARRRRYWKGHYVSALTDGFVAELARFERARPFYGEVELFQQGWAIADVPPDATAFRHRDAAFDVLAVGYWDDPSEDEARMAALRAAAGRFEPFSTGVYVNNLLDEGAARIRAAFGDATFERLARLKERIDPDNVFHRNANIPPAPAGRSERRRPPKVRQARSV